MDGRISEVCLLLGPRIIRTGDTAIPLFSLITRGPRPEERLGHEHVHRALTTRPLPLTLTRRPFFFLAMTDPRSPGELEMSPCMSRKSPSLSKSVGTVSLEQFRAQLVQDLAGRAVQAEDIDEFLDQLLPCPGANKRRKRACQKPPKEVNPFVALKDADKMTEADVVRIFVSTV